MPRLTKSLLDTLLPTDTERMLWDSALPGFGVRLRPGSGQKRFYVQYRLRSGKQRKRALGVYGVLTVEEARAQARQWLAQVAQGIDPAQQAQGPVPYTVRELAARYLREQAPRRAPESQRRYRGMLAQHILPALGSREVPAVTRADILALQARLADRPFLANRVLSLVSVLFTCAELWEWRAPHTHPVWRLPRFREPPRARYLTAQEVARLWAVLTEAERTRAEHPSVVGGIRLLLLTGARSGEMRTLKWEYLDWHTGVARLPQSKTGPKSLWFAPEALDVLRHLPRVLGNPYVLPGTLPGKPWQDLRRPWYRLRRAAGLPDARLHDLRHTYASIAVGTGLSLPEIGKLLGHRRAQTTQRYSHIADAVAHAAAAHTGAALARLLTGEGQGRGARHTPHPQHRWRGRGEEGDL